MNLKIVDEWRNAWKLISVQLAGLLGILAVVEANWGVFQKFVPDSWKPYIVLLFALGIVFGRLISQPTAVVQGQEKKLTSLASKIYELSAQYRSALEAMKPTANAILDSLTAAKAEYDRLYPLIRERASADNVTLASDKANPPAQS